MESHKISVLTQLLIASTLTFPAGAYANDALDKIIVTATRNTEDNKESSRNISVVDEENIAQQQDKSVPQLLRYLPNVSLTGGPRDQAQSVNIRGLGGNRVLQLIDGARQNFISGHRPSYFLDPALLKSVEVLKGPGSSLWGSGAMGGVVSQNTIHAADILDADDVIGGFVKQGYYANGDKWTTTGALATRYNDVDLLLSGYYRDGNDMELGNGDDLANSGYIDRGFLAKMDWFIDGAQTATFDFRHSKNSGGIPSNAAADVATSNALLDRDSNVDQAALHYRINPDNPLWDTQLSLYWNRTQVDESRVSDGRADTTELRTLGMNLSNRSELDKLTFIYGVDAYQDKLTASREGTNRPIVPEADMKVLGAFTEVHIPFANTWQLELGARYDYFYTEAKNLNQDRSDNAFSPSAALVWQTTPALKMVLRYDEAFRAPTSEELYTSGAHFCLGPSLCNTFVPNPYLKAEESSNWEFMAQYTMDGVLRSDDNLEISTNIFHNDVDNFIEQRVDDPVFFPFPDAGHTYFSNIADAKLRGFEMAMAYHLNDFNALLSYGQTRAQDKVTGESLASIPADKWVLDLSHSWLQKSIKAGVTVTRVEAQDHRPNDVMTDYEHYTLVDLYASWTPRDFDHLTVDLTVNNLTDQYYRMAFQQLYMPGKDIRLGIRYDF